MRLPQNTHTHTHTHTHTQLNTILIWRMSLTMTTRAKLRTTSKDVFQIAFKLNCFGNISLLSANPTKWTNTFLSVFDHLMNLALKGLENTFVFFGVLLLSSASLSVSGAKKRLKTVQGYSKNDLLV